MSGAESSVAAPVPRLFSPRERRILLWLTAGAVCWRWVCAVQSPLPGVEACRDLWLANRLAQGELSQLANAITQPWWSMLLWPAVAAGSDAFATAQVLACVLGGLLVWPVAVAAERLRQGAGIPAAVLALAAGGLAAAAGVGASAPLLAVTVAGAVVGLVARRWVVAAVAGMVALAPGFETILGSKGHLAQPWHWHELRLAWGTSAALALWSTLPPRPRCLPILGSIALAVLAMTFAFGAGSSGLLVTWPIVAVLAAVGLARLPARLRDIILCAAVLAEFWLGWQAIEPRASIVERALGQHLQRNLAAGQRVASDLPRVLLFAGAKPIAPRDSDALLEAASGDGVVYVVLGPVLARHATVTAALASRFAPLELPHDLGDLVAEGKLSVFVRR